MTQQRRLVTSGVAARALGVNISTINRWWSAGKITPAEITVGGHARWDLGELRAQLAELRKRGEDGS